MSLSLERQNLQNATVDRAHLSFDAVMTVTVIAKFPENRYRTYTYRDAYRVSAPIAAWQLYWDRKKDGERYHYLSESEIMDRISGYGSANSGCEIHTEENRLPKQIWVYVKGNVNLPQVSIDRLDVFGELKRPSHGMEPSLDVDRIRAPNSFPRSRWVSLGNNTWYYTYIPNGAEGVSVIAPRDQRHGGTTLFKCPLIAPVINGIGVRPSANLHFENFENMAYNLAQNYSLTIIDDNNMAH